MLPPLHLIDVVDVLRVPTWSAANTNAVVCDAFGDAFARSGERSARDAFILLGEAHADEIIESFEALTAEERRAFERAVAALGILVKRKFQCEIGEYSLSEMSKSIVEVTKDFDDEYVLQSINLTLPPSTKGIRNCARELSLELARSGGGALFVVEVGTMGREHIHGPALVPKGFDVVEHWRNRWQSTREACRVRDVTGWPERHKGVSLLLKNVSQVMAYAFERQPLQFGPRDLSRDIIAAGALAGTLERISALEGDQADYPGGAAQKPSFRSEKASLSDFRCCLFCGKRIGKDRRPNVKSCNARCRKAASRKRRAAIRALLTSSRSSGESKP